MPEEAALEEGACIAALPYVAAEVSVQRIDDDAVGHGDVAFTVA